MSPIKVIPFFLLMMSFGLLPGFAETNGTRSDVHQSAFREERQLSGENYFQKPLLGYVLEEPQGKLRPVWGTPGASIWGDPLKFDQELRWIVPGRNIGVVRSKENPAELAMINLLDPEAGEVRIPGSTSEVTMITLSPTGTSAAMLLAGKTGLQILSGLPDAPAVVQHDLAGLNAEPVSLAINEEAQTLVGMKRTGIGEVHLILPDGSSRMIAAAATPTALKFFPGTKTALLLDSAANSLSRLSLSTAGGATLIAGASEGIVRPLDMEISSDRERVFILNSDGREILTWELKNGGSTQLPLAESSKSLVRLEGTDIFRLTSCCGQPIWLLDGSKAEPRLVFVPAIKLVQPSDRLNDRTGEVDGRCKTRDASN